MPRTTGDPLPDSFRSVTRDDPARWRKDPGSLERYGRIWSSPCPGAVHRRSVHVALDGSLVAHLRVIGFEPGVPPRASLMEQIP